MEYVFGTNGEVEVLKTKGDSHSDLTGYHQVERTFPDQTITDTFRIVRKLDSQEDSEGSCYDWYEIDHHYRSTDRSGPVAEKAAQTAADLELAMCEQDAATDARLSDVELALCELDEKFHN